MSIWKKFFGKRVPPQVAVVSVPPKVGDDAAQQPISAVSSPSYTKGKEFERSVQELLYEVRASFPRRVSVTPQERVELFDGRVKIIDFGFEYKLASSRHQIAVECQDREVWSTEILDKILALRNHSHRNRFWFVYHDDRFLSGQAKKLLEKHGVLSFSIIALREHLVAVRRDLWAVENIERLEGKYFPNLKKRKQDDSHDVAHKYNPPADPSMLTRRQW